MPDRQSSISEIYVHPLPDAMSVPFCVGEKTTEFSRALRSTHDNSKESIEILRHNIGVSITWNALSTERKFVERAAPVAKVRIVTSEPVIVMHQTHAGQISVTNHNSATKNAIPEGMALFERDIDVDFTLNIEGDVVGQATTYIVSASSFAQVMGEETAALLSVAPRSTVDQASKIIPVPQHPYNTLQARLSTSLTMQMRKILTKTQMLEHICLFATHLSGLYSGMETSPRKEQLRTLYNELISTEGKIPSLNELSARYGMSVKTLNESFKQMFGDTIAAYIASRRLNDAHHILSETETPIKIVAAQLGYSHVNNFTNAFRQKFGYPPGSLRKKRA